MLPPNVKRPFVVLCILLFYLSSYGQVVDSFDFENCLRSLSVTPQPASDKTSTSSNDAFRSQLAQQKERYKGYYDRLNPSNVFEIPSLETIAVKKSALSRSGEDSLGFLSSMLNTGRNYLSKNSNVSGQFRLESFASNKRLPYQLSQPIYTRIYATPRVSILGLPFETDIYYTTEDNSFYNSNSIGFHFDPASLKKQGEDKLKKEIEDLKGEIKDNTRRQEKIDLYLDDVQRILKREKEMLLDLEKKAAEELEKQKSIAEQKALEKKFEVEGQLREQADSAKSSAIEQATPSDTSQLSDIQAKSATEIEKSKERIAELGAYYSKAKSLYALRNKKDSFLNNSIGNLKSKVDSIKQSSKGKAKAFYHENALVQSIEEFDIGNSNPYFSKNSISGIPVRGVNTKLAKDNRSVQILGGKTLANFSTPIEGGEPSLFTRNVAGLKLGISPSTSNQFSFLAVRLWDPISEDVTQTKANTVLGVDFQFKPLKKVAIEGEILTSTFDNDRRVGTNRDLGFVDLADHLNLGQRISIQSSAVFKAIGEIDKNTKIEAQIDQKRLGFNTLGTPFLRRDYRQADLKLTRKFLDRKIHVSTFYKNFTNNLSGNSEVTNSLKGLGFSAYSSFRKKPNFQITHLPFQQGNNHADTLFRTNNRLATTIVGVNYRKTYKTKRFYWLASYTRSAIEYFQLGNQLTQTQIYTLSQSLETPRLTLTTSFTASQVTPGVDTLNFKSVNVVSTYKYKQHRFTTSGSLKRSSSDNQMVIGSIGYSRSFKRNLTINLQSGIRYMNGYWGMKEEFIYQGLIGVSYTLNKKPLVIRSH